MTEDLKLPMGPQEAFYREKIAPMLFEARALCAGAGLGFVACVDFDSVRDVPGTGSREFIAHVDTELHDDRLNIAMRVVTGDLDPFLEEHIDELREEITGLKAS